MSAKSKKPKETNPFAVLAIDRAKANALTTIELTRAVDRAVRRVWTMMGSKDEVVAKTAREALIEYMNGQRALFASKGLERDRALNEAIVPSADANGKVWFRIVKRECTFGGMDLDADGQIVSANRGNTQSSSDRLGYSREQRRGKYNDGHMLINQVAESIDRSEYANWRGEGGM